MSKYYDRQTQLEGWSDLSPWLTKRSHLSLDTQNTENNDLALAKTSHTPLVSSTIENYQPDP
jgi:hypothetical protein